MSKKGIIIFLAFDFLVIGGFLAYKFLLSGKKGSKPKKYDWVTIDSSYQPQDLIEENIKNEAEKNGLLPVQIRNYGNDPKILGRFVGKKFANPRAAQLKVLFPGFDDWKIIDIRYKTEKQMEFNRTVLYVLTQGNWQIADNGKVNQ